MPAVDHRLTVWPSIIVLLVLPRRAKNNWNETWMCWSPQKVTVLTVFDHQIVNSRSFRLILLTETNIEQMKWDENVQIMLDHRSMITSITPLAWIKWLIALNESTWSNPHTQVSRFAPPHPSGYIYKLLKDPTLSQQHEGLHYAIFWPYQEVTQAKARFAWCVPHFVLLS